MVVIGEAINLLFDNVDYQMFSNDTIKAYISIFEHVGALYFGSYENDGKRIQLRKCLEYAESFIDRIQVPFVKMDWREYLFLIMNGLEVTGISVQPIILAMIKHFYADYGESIIRDMKKM